MTMVNEGKFFLGLGQGTYMQTSWAKRRWCSRYCNWWRDRNLLALSELLLRWWCQISM